MSGPSNFDSTQVMNTDAKHLSSPKKKGPEGPFSCDNHLYLLSFTSCGKIGR
ncbi:hypothetical protein H4684_001267 [Desulfomicrobium macestii]|uniref:Uncharacterized protein n=1 Tax=Desulfomicrobium macestii TaxID=90731 RepID=A0ABR9H235_9BACT|nr:hypothetical protein [Desulfomicrobium macestii]